MARKKKTKSVKSEDIVQDVSNKNETSLKEKSEDSEVLLENVEIKDILAETNEVADANLEREIVIADSTNLTRDLYDKTRYGEPTENKSFQYSLIEGLYLLERGKFKIKSSNKVLDFDSYVKKARKIEPNFWVRYCVFKDLRKRGYIVKTALKFGADFRVYDRGVKPGEDHAKWIVYPVSETNSTTWHEFAAKNRVAHSTRNNLLIGVVDDEAEVSYWVVTWIRP